MRAQRGEHPAQSVVDQTQTARRHSTPVRALLQPEREVSGDGMRSADGLAQRGDRREGVGDKPAWATAQSPWPASWRNGRKERYPLIPPPVWAIRARCRAFAASVGQSGLSENRGVPGSSPGLAIRENTANGDLSRDVGAASRARPPAAATPGATADTNHRRDPPPRPPRRPDPRVLPRCRLRCDAAIGALQALAGAGRARFRRSTQAASDSQRGPRGALYGAVVDSAEREYCG
jgi:hypothetical protein